MRRRNLIMLILMAAAMTGRAQSESKYSPSTQMFLSEQRGEVQLPKANSKAPLTMTSLPPVGAVEIAELKLMNRRKIAEVEQVGGVEMISAFICVSNNNFAGIEPLGVAVQGKFNNMVAALIPVDKIEEVAALDNVTKIEVAEVLEPVNDRQRVSTQAGDAISNSAAARALGLAKQYTGKDVILGIIDTGIDFQHVAFKDASGNSRIVLAYTLSGTNSTSLTTHSTASAISALTYDTNDGDHGTHTCTTAGGSSVKVNGSTVTVTDDHANATYGGMAPEANLVIAGLSSLYTTSIGTAIQNICNYADQVGKPCVISLSLGSQVGPHDGTGTIASIVDQYAGDNHIIVYAASNDGMRASSFVDMGVSNGGGMYASGTSTSNKPMIVNVQRSFSDADGNVEMLYPTITAYARTANVPLSLKFHVVNVNTGAVVYSSSAYSSSTTISVTGSTGLAQYFKSSTSYQNMYGDAGSIRIVRTQDSSNNKYYWQIYCPIMISTSYADSDGDGVYNGDYAFCVSVYPTSTTASTVVDMWESYYSWFGTDLNLSSDSYNYCKGNDDCSVSDNACYSKVISVGAYVTRNSVTNYAGTVTDASGEYPNIGDHASFSSWQTEGYGPLGTPLPHISAPGARIVAGVNSYHTSSVDDYSYWSDDYIGDLVVNNTNHAAYAAMEGTSMATPCVSGIIAQWLQACVEKGITPTPDYIKEVMAATWDTDEWTAGTGSGAHGAKTFGTHGKINAIKGLQYILGATASPTINVSSDNVSFTKRALGTYTETVTVTGLNLEGNISVVLNDESGLFSIDKTSFTAAEAAEGAPLTITYAPIAFGQASATITLSSPDATAVTINLSGIVNDLGKATDAFLNIAKYATIDEAGWNTNYVNNLYKYTEDKDNSVAWLTLPVYGAWSSVYYNSHPQKWIDSNVTSTSNKYAGTSWNASENLLGSSSYFTSTTARGMGYNSRTNYTQETVTFYVTNTTAVNMLGLGQSRSNSSYPATLNVYECTENTDGTLSALTTAVQSKSNSATTGTFVLSATNLDADKIYKVEAATYRSLICEIGFQTPLATPATPVIEPSLDGTIVSSVTEAPIPVGTSEATTLEVKGSNLKGDITATLSGDTDAFSITKQTATARALAPRKAAADQTLTITPVEAEAGATIVIGFAPTEAKDYTATLTLSTEGATPQQITLTGTGVQPEFIVTPETLTFADGTIGESSTQTFYVLGENLSGDITASLTGDAAFSLSTNTISVADAQEGATVTVTFAPTESKSYSATVTLTSPNAETATVSLTGSATPAYFDATITSAQLSTMYLDFPVTIPYDNVDLLGVYYVYDTSNKSDLRMARINETIPPYTGVILHGNSGTYRFHKATDYTPLARENKLSGSVVKITPAEALAAAEASENAKVYTLGIGSGGYINFYRFTGSYLNPYKAFLIYEDINNSRTLSISWADDTTTGIDRPVVTSDDDEWFTLQGVRLSKRPTHSGLYIHHGETVVVK